MKLVWFCFLVTGAIQESSHDAVSTKASLSSDTTMAQVIGKWQTHSLFDGVGGFFLTFNISGVLRSLLDLIPHRHW